MQPSGLNVSELEAIIGRINGVIDCRIIASEDQIDEIHVLANLRRMPKQLVRDIESACMACFGLRIDHKKVSIAQLAEETAVAKTENICLHSLGLEYISGNLEVKVEVDFQGQLYSGRARGTDTPTLRLRLVAQAILSALESAQKGMQFILEEIRSEVVGRNQVILASLVVIGKGEETHLVGMGQIDNSDIKAAADAVLSAAGMSFC